MKANCSKLAKAVNDARNLVEKRYQAIQRDRWRLPWFGKNMTVASHQKEYRDSQRGLKNDLKKWNDSGCNTPGSPPISGDAWKFSVRGAPNPLGRTIPWATLSKYGTYAAVGVGAVALGAAIVFAPEVVLPILAGGGSVYAR